MNARFGRFLAAGSANTLVSNAIYLMLLNVLPYEISFICGFAAGIWTSYVLQRNFVFRSAGRRHAFAWVGAIYLLQLCLGTWLVHVWVAVFKGAPFLAPLVAIAIYTPITYLLFKAVFRARVADLGGGHR